MLWHDLPSEPFLRRDLDVSRRTFDSLVASGEIRQILRGVYVAGDDDGWSMRAKAVALVAEPHHVFIDRTAAWLHGIDVLNYRELDALPPVEVATLPGLVRTERTGTHGRNRALLPEDIEVRGDCRLTTVRRTALDLGCNLNRPDAYATLNQFSRLHNALSGQLAEDLARFRGRRGVVQLRELLPLVDPRIESPGESWLRLAIHNAQLPSPTPQVWVDADGESFRLDFAYAKARIAIEYDGEKFHSQAHDIAHDERRRQWLRDHGWLVIVVRSADLRSPALEAWTGRVRAALASARSNLRW